jgi:hypothetical protein
MSTSRTVNKNKPLTLREMCMLGEMISNWEKSEIPTSGGFGGDGYYGSTEGFGFGLAKRGIYHSEFRVLIMFLEGRGMIEDVVLKENELSGRFKALFEKIELRELRRDHGNQERNRAYGRAAIRTFLRT